MSDIDDGTEVAPPTEPGYYFDNNENACTLYGENEYFDARWFDELGDFMTPREVLERMPFTRLEPVPVTAKKVLDRIIEEHRDGFSPYMLDLLEDVGHEFGVTS